MTRKEKYVSVQETRAQVTREKLLLAAIELVNERGMKYLTVRNICEKVGLSTGSFYNLFSGKDELVGYYLKYVFNAYKQQAEKEAKNYNPIEKILLLYRFYIDCCLKAGLEFVSGVYAANTNPLFDFLDRDSDDELVLGKVREYVEEGKQAGIIQKDVSTDVILLRVATIVTGTVFYWCAFQGEMDLKYENDDMLKTYLLSICTKEVPLNLEPLPHGGRFA